MVFDQYLGKTVRVELGEGKAIAGLCSKVTKASESPTKQNTISITIMDTMDIEILESEVKKIEIFTW
ncbi:hypothetical protein [Intestinibacter sp.]|uniref:hypothetical protein n=1 Tax=Intestinibacter sp. TaxID=1965304 RepID=UPI002A75EE8E|nr:hypothetical protein [Intestinibacter sp.]MDY2737207.1 hypothetical protein [Intestinibacter sp.]MDY4573431.1 hypothetical protein [Intestinibacter sp.]